MASTCLLIRDALYTHLLAQRNADAFVVNDWSISKEYVPSQQLETMNPDGELFIVPMSNSTRQRTRAATYELVVPIHVVFQAPCNHTDVTTADNFVELMEQIAYEADAAAMPAATSTFMGASWRGMEGMRDQTGALFNFQGLSSGNYFEAFYIAEYVAWAKQ